MFVTTGKPFWVYMLASKRNGTLYIGSTDDLNKRIWDHKNDVRQGFTSRYGVKTLVWYEAHEARSSAFQRERQMKKWERAWKIKLIEEINPDWRDLYETLNG
ncbi:MAG: GIY-YIG nuclease family protein [Pseudomonadota bacterium]